jgi:hypothetical protein
MPTNKLWIEHTERAAWDSVEALRERLVKAESRLQALASGVDRVPELLDLLDEAKRRHAPDARAHDEIVSRLLSHIEKLQADLDAAKTPEPTVVSFAPAPPRPRLDSDDLDDLAPRGRGNDDFDLSSFTQTMQRRHESTAADPPRDLERLLGLAETKLDDLTELEGGALREAAVELAILAAKIHAASRARL